MLEMLLKSLPGQASCSGLLVTGAMQYFQKLIPERVASLELVDVYAGFGSGNGPQLCCVSLGVCV